MRTYELIQEIDFRPKKEEKTENKGEKKYFIETYGCQMNFSDSEIVASILEQEGFTLTHDDESADLVLLNTCSVRENAEQKVRNRLVHLNSLKKKKPGMLIGVLGCMAERLKKKLLDEEQMVDIVAGPDAYRDIGKLVREADENGQSINVFLSRDETYADIAPVRLNSNGLSAFISITRGCDNMCSFCVVPFTRGRERSRNPQTILNEAQHLFSIGYREVTLLGQNVDSYKFFENEIETDFADLLEAVANISPLLRVRFTTSHPKDMTNKVLHTMAKYANICKCIHLPVQSGSSPVLERMNRTYDRNWFMQRVEAIKQILGDDCAITTDVIAGFCGETDNDHADTLSILEWAKFDYAYMFAYSERPGTLAHRKYADDIPDDVKKQRLQQIIDLQGQMSLLRMRRWVGRTVEVLVEGPSKRNPEQFAGRNSQNHMVVFDKADAVKGELVTVLITSCTQATLIGQIVR